MSTAAEKLIAEQLSSQDTRIQTVEAAMINLTTTVTPSLVRLEEGMDHIKEKLDDVQKDVADSQARLSDGHRTFTEQDYRIKALEEDKQTRKERRGRVLKTVLGVVGTLIGALILAWLGVG